MNSRPILKALVSMASILAFVFFCLVQMSRMKDFQLFGEVVPRVETAKKFVALTFDDGPKKDKTDMILKILEEERVQATFFLLGSEMKSNPDETRKIIAGGHEIGNHGYSHTRMVWVTVPFVEKEIESTDQIIRELGYPEEILFRPPYGAKLFTLPWYLSSKNRASITWDVDPESFAKTSNQRLKYTVANTKNGSIVLLHVMHDSNAETMKAVRPIIHALRKKGFEFLTVSDLLNLK